MDIENLSLERKSQMLRARKTIKNFDKNVFEFLCNFEDAGKFTIDEAISLLKMNYPLEQVKFLVELQKYFSYKIVYMVESCFKRGAEIYEMQFLLNEEANQTPADIELILDAIYKSKCFQKMSEEQINLLKAMPLSNSAMDYFADNLDKVTPAKIELVAKYDMTGWKYIPESRVLQAIVVDDFSEEMVDLLVKYKDDGFKLYNLYLLFKAGFPFELFVEYTELLDEQYGLLDSCSETVRKAIDEKIDFLTIKDFVLAKNIKKFEELIKQVKKNKENEEICQNFKNLYCEFEEN